MLVQGCAALVSETGGLLDHGAALALGFWAVGLNYWLLAGGFVSPVEIVPVVGPLVGACHFDIAHFCSDIEPGGGRVASCLQTNKDRLTPECRDRIGKPAAP